MPSQPETIGTSDVLRLKVQDATGRLRTLDFSGISGAEAMRRAAARGFAVLSLETDTPAKPETAKRRIVFPLILFSHEFLALLEAGLNLTEALTTLHAKEKNSLVRPILQQILQAIHEGRSFSEALNGFPEHFPPVYVATIKASERTGDLSNALSRYIAYQIQFDALRKKLTAAAIYPALLISVGGLVSLFLLGYVVPRFATVYESSGRDIPWLSSLLLSFGRTIHDNWQIALSAFVAGVILLGWCARQRMIRVWLANQALCLPFLAEQANAFRLARFYRGVSLLLSAGIALPRALEMVAGLLAPEQQTRLQKGRVAVEEGQPLSVALYANGLTTPVAESLIKVGERSGQMAQMLERTASFADEEFSRWIDWITRLLEPLLMTVMGVVIGTIVVLMYMPIFELVGSLQ
jgi:general secretion pathway protein F